jgi:hypothetical protein
VVAIVVAGAAGVWVVLGNQESRETTSIASPLPRGPQPDARVCSALEEFDSHRRSLNAYLNDLDADDAESVRARHGDLLEAMLATASRLFGTSSDESEFSALELAIGDWMQEVDGAMTMVDSAFRTGDSGFLDDAEGYLDRASEAEATIDRLRGAEAC